MNFKTALEKRIALLNLILMQYVFETENIFNTAHHDLFVTY